MSRRASYRYSSPFALAVVGALLGIVHATARRRPGLPVAFGGLPGPAFGCMPVSAGGHAARRTGSTER